ncbi:hydrolase, alpha/beta domain protein [Necator americanus]|uniref:Hydrolase, alpha/beta domain protein n=1 Tax=Necator americanus TaxID=51031 RepID=W2TPF2_NECAM|nr:hydrolase, alpha/beta domain protein [Necator americanus]ETN82862.1 hydrolase, alpha/beta domain protein [Necator americanus]
MTAYRQTFIEANGIRLHVAEQGDGPLVLLCHGFPETSHAWRYQMAALAHAGFRAMAPDLRGYGLSECPTAAGQYTTWDVVGDLVALVDILGERDAVVVGNDWGATIAWQAALLRPDRFRAVVALGVPMMGRAPMAPSRLFPQTDQTRFYTHYFSEPGLAETELERDGGRGGSTGANGTGTGTGTTAVGGVGIQGSNLQIVNGGMIAGGVSGDGSTRANAITFTSGNNSLQLQLGWNFVGNVVGSNGTTNTLILGGDTTDLTSDPAGTSASTVFALSQIGTTFQGFTVFQKAGAGTWALIGSTSASTPWTISAGTLQLGDGTTNGSISGDVADNATLAFDPASGMMITASGAISGTGQVQQIGTGVTVLSGVNTYTGGTTISAGTLQVSADSNLGASTGALAFNGGTLNTTATFASSRATTLGTGGGTFDVSPSTTLTMGGVISGAGALTKIDSGTLLLTGADTYSGGTTISGGTLQLGDGATNGGISGTGQVQQLGTGTTVLSGVNTYTGGTTVNAGTLQLTNGSAAGTGTVTVNTTAGDATQGLNLDFASAGTFANTLAGSGDTTVAAGSALTTLAGANAGYTGDWQIAGSAAIAPASATSTANLGSGTVNIASGGSLAATTSGAFSFSNALTGSGTLSASNSGQAFSFGPATGSTFSGTVALSNDTFALSGNTTTALTHATLVLGTGNVTTVGDGNQAIGALTFNGGTAVFDGTAPGQQAATSLITTGALNVSGTGTVRINVPNPYAPPVPTASGGLSLFQQSHISNGLELVSATSVTGNASGLTLEDQNGTPVSAVQNVDIQQNGNLVAIGTYNYALGTGTANNGLYVGYTLKQLALQAGQSLTLTEDPGATGANADMAAQLTGTGNLVIAANNVVSLSNTDNTFTGTTLVQTGTLQANAANVIASSSAVDVASTFNTNGFSQSLNNLTGDAAALVLLSGNDVLTLHGSGTPTTFAGAITGAGSLVQASGTEVLTAVARRSAAACCNWAMAPPMVRSPAMSPITPRSRSTPLLAQRSPNPA